MNNLFQLGDFTLRSGSKSKWKIECDALTKEDWDGLAAMAIEILPPFKFVAGVLRGGVPFAHALEKYRDENADTLLVAEDVVTTGGSMEQHVGKLRISYADKLPPKTVGICVFARGKCPHWVTALFQMPEAK